MWRRLLIPGKALQFPILQHFHRQRLVENYQMCVLYVLERHSCCEDARTCSILVLLPLSDKAVTAGGFIRLAGRELDQGVKPHQIAPFSPLRPPLINASRS